MGANHFCRMSCVCVVTIPNFSKVPLISLLIWACAFCSIFCFVFYPNAIQYSKCHIYVQKLPTHYQALVQRLLQFAFLFCFGFVCFFFWVYLCQCHESSCHLLMSPLLLRLYCVELLVNVYCDVLNLNSWFKTLQINNKLPYTFEG